MKPNIICAVLVGILLSVTSYLRAADTLGQTNSAVSNRIGVYDSRAVAFAWFWTQAHQTNLNQQMEQAKAAKLAGETNIFKQLAKNLADEQKKMHHEVFGTEPAVEAMKSLEPRLPEIQQRAGISTLVSKWDAETLKKHETAQQIDVTDVLVSEFQPTAEQLKTIAEIKKQKPVPVEKIKDAD
jgi:hypothetical protein